MINRPRTPLQEWDQRLQKSSQTKFVTLIRKLCLAHPTFEHSSTLYGLMSQNASGPDSGPDWNAVLKLADSMSEQMYPDAWQHFQANQFAALFRKYPFTRDSISLDPELEARKKFFRAEHKCFRMNQRLVARRSRIGKAAPFEYDFDSMRKFIAYVIGFAPIYSHIWSKCGFGPGAAIGVHGNATNYWRKLSSNWSVTSGAYHYAFAAVMSHAQVREVLFSNPGGFTSSCVDYDPVHGPFSKKVDVVAYNKITFVPKTAKTHRVIAIEPLLNSFVQKGVDEHMRVRLKRIGIDLSDQKKNSEFARLGSLPGAEDPFCTIDLSSASDSISIEIVRELLPPEWFEFLNSIRSKNFLLDKDVTSYHKFCSMGNGFCFPLETLLFAAACHAVGAGQPGKDFLVYGDDIVIRQSKATELIKLLAYMGFTTNKEKTFIEGPFRESCGKDWFGGIDVRPYTLNFRLDSIQSMFKLLNGTSQGDLRKLFFQDVRDTVVRWVPQQFRFFRPFPGPDDSGIDSTQDEFLTSPHCSCRFKNGTGSWRWRELIAEPVPDKGYKHSESNAYALVYAALIGSASDSPFTLRRRTKTKVRVISHPGATSLWLPS